MHNLVLDSLAMRDAKKVYVSVLASDDRWYHVIGVGVHGEVCGRACNNAPLGAPFSSLRWVVETFRSFEEMFKFFGVAQD